MTRTRRDFLKSSITAAAAGAAGGLGFHYLRHRPRKNVILIVADALRADVVGAKRAHSGNALSITPNLDRLAREGTSFSGAIAPSSWTPTSMGAILYSTEAPNVVYGPRGLEVRSAGASIAAHASDMGRFTACVNANAILDTNVIRDGFDEFAMLRRADDTINGQRDLHTSAIAVNRSAFKLVPRLAESRSYFLYLHYMDTHEPYFSTDGTFESMGGKFDISVYTSKVREAFLEGRAELREGEPMNKAIAQLRLHYDASVRFLDNMLAGLLKRFDEQGLLDDTLVIVTSDHGEEFADNRETAPNIGHARNLSQAQIHSPLIMWTKRRSFLRNSEILGPVSTAGAVRAAMDAFAFGPDRARERSPFAPRPEGPGGDILSILNFRDVNAFSFVRSNLKVLGKFGEGGSLEEVSAFRLSGAGGAPQRIAAGVSNETMAVVRDALEGRAQTAFDRSGLPEEELEKLRKLGYLN